MLLQTSMDVSHQYKTPRATQLPFTALFLSAIKDAISANHLYCAQCIGCKEQKHRSSALKCVLTTDP